VSVLVAGEGRTRGKRRYLWLIVLAAGILFEYQSFWGQPLRPAQIPAAVAALRDDASIRAVFDVPYQYVLAAKDGLYLQTAHQHPLIAGQITRQTPVNPAKLEILQATLDPALLYEAGADVVIFHHARMSDNGEAQVLRNRLNRQLGAPFYQDERIALYRVGLPATVMTQAALPQQSGTISDMARYALYVPEDQWVDVVLDFTAEGRDLLLLLDDRPAHFWNIRGNRVFQLPLALEAGYHNLTMQVVPPCPVQSDPLLRCLTVSYAVNGEPVPGELRGGTTFDGGITLRWVDMRVENDQLAVRLFWVLNEARSTRDVRFVHVVDRSGQVIVQRDTPPGMLDANSIYPEIINLPISELAAGQYSVRVGWYRLEETGSYTNYLANEQPFYTIGEFRR
jgi:hypothetical protein